MPKWFVFLAPIAATLSEIFVGGITQIYMEMRALERKYSDDEEKIANICVAVYSFFVSYFALIFNCWMFISFTEGFFKKIVCWVIIPIIVFITILIVFNPYGKIMDSNDFKKDIGLKIISYRYQNEDRYLRLNIKSNWTKLRFFLLWLSWILSILIFLFGKLIKEG